MAFLEEIGKHLTDAGQNVAQQTKGLAEVTKLNLAVSEKEKRITQLFTLVGQAYYEKHKEDECAEELQKIKDINALYREIAEDNEKIKLIKGVVKCEGCGADVSIGSAYCKMCGMKVVTTPVANTTEADGDRCPKCNQIVIKGNKFCMHCGTKIETTND